MPAFSTRPASECWQILRQEFRCAAGVCNLRRLFSDHSAFSYNDSGFPSNPKSNVFYGKEGKILHVAQLHTHTKETRRKVEHMCTEVTCRLLPNFFLILNLSADVGAVCVCQWADINVV